MSRRHSSELELELKKSFFRPQLIPNPTSPAALGQVQGGGVGVGSDEMVL